MDPEELKKLLEEQGEAFDGFKTRYDAELAAERKEREDLEARLNRQGLVTARQAGGATEIKAEHAALGMFAAKGDNSGLVEMKAMSVGSDPNGGYLVLPHMSDSMESKIFDQSAIKRLARVELIPSGDSFEEVVDHGDAQAVWTGEQDSRPDTDTPTLGMHRVPLHEIYAAPKVTQKLLDTSHVNIGRWLEGKVADRFGRSQGAAFVNGDSVGKPTGILSGTPVITGDDTRDLGTLQYIPSGNASGLSSSNPADVLKQLVWKLRAPYRNGAVWIMNSNTASVLDQIKDGGGQYIWRTGMLAGSPPSLLGYEVAFDEVMPDIGANAFPVALGNFRLGYVVVELEALKVLRDPFTSKPNVIFYTYQRVGGDVSNSEAIKLLKIATA